MTIYPLSEGAFTIDQTKKFVPFNLKTDDLQARTTGSLLVEIQPFLIKTGKDLLLLDTGLGFKDQDGKCQVVANIEKNGFHAEDITKVLLSHLHKDHAGGIANGDSLMFTNANYYVSRKEFDAAFNDSTSSYNLSQFEVLKNSSALVLLDDEGDISGTIHYALTGGHSPFHQAFWIKENGETAFFGGDVAPQLQQMRSRFVAKYDYDGKLCMELRRKWWEEGSKENWTFLFYHDIKNPVYKSL
jgi:glyoxylase-like metal-dependent hydrolase (beta-lactamase superfamily II)